MSGDIPNGNLTRFSSSVSAIGKTSENIEKIQLNLNFQDFCIALQNYSNASEEGKIEIINNLNTYINKPNFPNYKNKQGDTPLIKVSEHGFTEIAEILLNNGADPTIQNYNGNNALILACNLGHTEMVQSLLNDQRVDPNIQNRTGATALILASYRGHTNIVALLMNDNRVDPNIQDADGYTALIISLLGNENNIKKYEIVQILLNKLPIKIPLTTRVNTTSSTTSSTEKTLYLNGKKRKGESGRNLMFPSDSNLSLGVNNKNNVTFKKKSKNNQLQNLSGNEDFSYTLDINISNNFGKNALMFAVDLLDKDIIKLLVEKGANALLKNKFQKNSMEIFKDIEISKRNGSVSENIISNIEKLLVISINYFKK